MKDIKELEEIISLSFSNKELLKKALTHRSLLNESSNIEEHNERLEFLGDAVLELITTDFLFRSLPQTSEGKMTKFRAALVRKETLAEVAMTLGLGKFLYMSHGEENTGGRTNPYILANSVEALIGAIYIDQGIENAKSFIETSILTLFEKIKEQGLHKDSKSVLQEEAQKRISKTPTYHVIKEEGPDHMKVYTSEVLFGNEPQATGNGRSKRLSEIDAAKNALKILQWDTL